MKIIFGVFLIILSCLAFAASAGKPGRCDTSALVQTPCDALYMGWTYNLDTNECDSTTLQACGEYEIGFTDKDECEETCKSD